LLKYPPPYYSGGNYYYATPWLWIDGNKEASYLTNIWKSKIDQALDIPSPIEIGITGKLDSALWQLNITFSIRSMDTMKVEGKFFAALTEDGIAWSAPNNVRIHNYVPRIWWPNSDGQSSTIEAGQTTQFSVNWPLEKAWVMDNLTVVAFLQNPEQQDNEVYPVYQGASRWVLDMITGLETDSPLFPGSIRLYQNYPNPFNPVTNIAFELNRDSEVLLTVFDLAGREVGRLVNERLKAGKHSYIFDGGQLSAGVYFYRLASSRSSETRKMMLIR